MNGGRPRVGARLREIAIPTAIVALSVYLWTVASDFRGGVARYEAIGPAFFPKLLLGAVIGIGLLQIAAAFVRRAEPAAGGRQIYWADLVLALIITGIYAASLHAVGFLIATPLFQAVMLRFVLQVRNRLVLLAIPLALTLILAIVFLGLMSAPLPRGRWLFGEVSRLVY